MLKKINIAVMVFILVGSRLFSYSYLPDNMPLNKALIAIAHNSPMSKAYNWIYYQQLGAIEKQWAAGARGVKIPIQWRKPLPTSSPYVAMCHEYPANNNCDLTLLQRSVIFGVQDLKGFLAKFAKLLKDNPRDVAIITLEDKLNATSSKSGTKNYTPDKIAAQLNDVLEKSGIAQYALKLPAECSPLKKRPPQDWPTVGQMRNSGKRVVIFTGDKSNADRSPYLNYEKNFFSSTHWEFKILDEIENNRVTMKYTLPLGNAFKVEHKDISSVPKGSGNSIILDIIGKLGIDTKGYAETDYHVVNSKEMIKKRIKQAYDKIGQIPSVIAVDMIEIGETGKAVQEINTERIQKLQNP